MSEEEWLTSTEPAAMLQYLGPLNFKASNRKLRLFAAACTRIVYGNLPDPEEPPSGWDALQWATRWAAAEGHLSADPPAALRAALLRDIFGSPWITYQWSNDEQRAVRGLCSRGSQDQAGQERYAARVGEDGGRNLDQTSVESLERSGRAGHSKGLRSTSHRRRQSERRHNQSGIDSEGSASAVPRGQTERETDGDAVRRQDGQMLPMPGEFPGAIPESGCGLLEVPEDIETRTSVRPVSANRGVIVLDRRILTWNNGTVPALARTIYDERRFEDLLILADALEEAGCLDKDILKHCRGAGPHVRGCWVLDLLLGNN